MVAQWRHLANTDVNTLSIARYNAAPLGIDYVRRGDKWTACHVHRPPDKHLPPSPAQH